MVYWQPNQGVLYVSHIARSVYRVSFLVREFTKKFQVIWEPLHYLERKIRYQKGEKQMGVILVFLAVGAVFWFFFSYLLGYRNKNITMTFDDRFYTLEEHVKAIEEKLTQDGKQVEYIGNRQFLVDGKKYLFVERTVSMSGVPMQQTILEFQK